MRLLLIESDRDLGRSVESRLRLGGHGVDWTASIAGAEDHLATTTYDLILLDVSQPGGEGRDFLSAHRRARRDTPVIVVTGATSALDRAALLDGGADDCVTKPFDFAELEARVRAVLRRRMGASQPELSFRGLTFDPLRAALRFGAETRELRNRELRLFEILLSAPERIFSKGQLCDRLFSAAEAVSENAIEVYVGRLRRKLDGSDVRIETVRGVGYRVTGR